MKKMPAHKIILLISVPLFLFGVLLLFIPKSPMFLIKTPDKINDCDMICNQVYSIESLTISGDDLKPLLDTLTKVRIQYDGQYECISFDEGEWIYYLYFREHNSPLGEITIDEKGFLYDKHSRYKILGEDRLAVSVLLRHLIESREVR